MKKINSKNRTRSFLQITMLLSFFVLPYNLEAQITAPVANAEYFVTNVYSGKRLENSDGNYVVHRTANNTDRLNRQKFTFELVSGRYKIKNVHTGYYAYKSGGWDLLFQASTSDSWLLEASSGKTIIKWDGSNHWGVDTSGEGVYWSKAWSTSPNTRLQWEITFASYGKTALQTAITTATTTKNAAVVGTANGAYFQSDYDTFVAAIATAQGVYDSPTSQEQINTATTTLNTARTTFLASVITKTALQTAITDATSTKNAAVVGTTQGRYLQADYDTFNAAITSAQGVYDSPTSQAQINSAVTTLNTARTNFLNTMIKFVPEADKYYMIKYGSTELALSSRVNTYAEINTLNSENLLQRIRFEDVPSQSGKYFVLNGNDAYLKQSSGNAWDLTWGSVSDLSYNGNHFILETVNETDVRIKSVKSAYLGVDASSAGQGVWADKASSSHVWRIVSAPDLLIKTVLESAITDATTTKNSAVVGTTQGRFLQTDYDTFVAAIAAAQSVYDNPTSQIQINAAITTLNTAKSTFTATMIKFVPVAGRYYTIKYKEIDIAFSKSSSTSGIQLRTTNPSDVLQRIRFVADNVYPGSYWIYNGNNQALSQIYGNSYNMDWETPANGSTWNGYRYYLETINETDIRIKSVKSGLYLGVDATTDGTTVYSDKNNTHYWKNYATDYYSSASSSDLGLNASSSLTVEAGATLTINSATTLNSLVVSPGAKITINAGQTLTTSNGITLESDATGTATIVDSYNTPTINATVKQYVEAGRNWYVSSPVSAAGYGVLSRGNSVVTFNETTKLWETITSGNLISGKGYIQVATAVQGTTGTVDFNGLTNSGNVTVQLTRTGTTQAGFNLVGNPYPSYLDWSLVAAANTNVLPTVWFRTKKTTEVGGGYTFTTVNVENETPIIVSNDASTTITKYIPPMQAYWVRLNANPSTNNFTVTNAMRNHLLDAGNRLKAPKQDELRLIRLKVSNATNSDETVIYFTPNASDTYDRFDSPKMFNNSASVPEIYTQAGEEKLVINGFTKTEEDREVPIGFVTSQANDFTLTVSEFKNFDASKRITLIDKLTNTETELGEGISYNFNSESIVASTNRFSLLFKTPVSTTDIEKNKKTTTQVYVNSANKITIIAPINANYAIYNAVGQIIENGSLTSNNQTSNFNFASGVYVVKVNNKSTRVVIK